MKNNTGFLLLLFAVFLMVFISASARNTVASPNAGFELLESFDNMLNGSINGQGEWVGSDPGAQDGALVSANPPDWFAGKAFLNNHDNYQNRGNAYRQLNGSTVQDGVAATLYLQLSIDSFQDADFSVGLGTDEAPSIFNASASFNHFGAEVRFDSAGLSIRNGSSYQAVTNYSLPTEGLVHLWIYVDHSNDNFEVYVDDPFSTQTRLLTSGGNTFVFRDGTNNASFKSFVIQNHGTSGSDSYLDSLYLDLSIKNLGYPAGNFEMIETFEEVSLGSLNNQNGWTVNDNSIDVANDPAALGNRVGLVTGVEDYSNKQIVGVEDGRSGTLFFRMYRSGVFNGFIGLSDSDNPTTWGDFEIQFGSQDGDSNDFRVRSGGAFQTLNADQYQDKTWYCVWLTPNNQTDDYSVYVKGGAFETITQLESDSGSIFDFRNGTSDRLQSLLIRTGPGTTGGLYIDDFYLDSGSENFTQPTLGSCEPDEGDPNNPVDNNDPIDNPIPAGISSEGTTARLETVATVPASGSDPKTRINYLFHAKDGSNRLFVNDLRGKLTVVNPETGATSTYIDISTYFSEFKTTGSLNAGFSTFAFHPDFESNGKFYTIHSENPNGSVDFGHPNTDRTDSWTHGVLVEWTANDSNSNSYSGSQPRELMRILQSTPLHGVQLIEFNRTASSGDDDYGMLYISIGDSEAEPFFSDVAQDVRYPQGKILRIDPLGNNSANGEYGIPSDNPFVDTNNGTIPEIFAIGFRNPVRFDWDPITKMMLVSVIGQNNIEEVELVEAGRNYGWNEREGTFRFDPNNPDNVYPIPADDDPAFTYPVAQYDHDEGFAIIGGFVYRGSLMPRLYGTYIFGDIVKGHFFYIKLNDIELSKQAPIYKLTLETSNGDSTTFNDLINSSRGDLRFGLDADGEIYAFSKQDGVIRRMYSEQGPPANQSPSLNFISDQSNVVGDLINLQLSASDLDGDNLDFSATNLPSGLFLNESSGLVAGQVDQASQYNVQFVVSDGRGGSDSQSIVWTVGDPPIGATATVPLTPTDIFTPTPMTGTPRHTPTPDPAASETPTPVPTSTIDPVLFVEIQFLPVIQRGSE